MAASAAPRALRILARLHGIQTSYLDCEGHTHEAGAATLLAVLEALSAPIRRPEDAGRALRLRRQELARRALEPVHVAWEGRLGSVLVRLPAGAGGTARCTLRREDGSESARSVRLADLALAGASRVEGRRFVARRLRWPGPLPLGYHELRLEIGGAEHASLVIAAPRKAHGAADERLWGLFLPLYALRTRRGLGCGNFSDLRALAEWVASQGGSVVGTLPLLASFLDQPFDDSPYRPASRLHWNEAYLDLAGAPECAASAEASRLLRDPELRAEAAALNAADLVDWGRVFALKRHLLGLLARALLRTPGPRRDEFLRFQTERADVVDYARFRAVLERRRRPWQEWPARLREGDLRPPDFDAGAAQAWTYAQWLAREQLAAAAAAARQRGPGLYLDFPLGVHPAAYDTWRERSLFATGASAGAPPDPLAPQGQDWRFPPLHPQRLREQGYRYLRACLRRHLEFAGVLRLDHVLGLHRLFWVPEGLGAANGAYVRYPAAELYAILCLESRRHRVRVVGEDLGTVPGYVRPALDRHNVARMYVLPFEAVAHPARALRPVPRGAAACLNTHDLPPFAAWWDGPAAAALRRPLWAFLRRRGLGPAGPPSARAALGACLRWLAASSAAIVLINLEDLWLERRPQNVPGTGPEAPNWRRKAALALEDFSRAPDLVETFVETGRLRAAAAGPAAVAR